MSTAVMPASANYDFGDMIFKNGSNVMAHNLLKVHFELDNRAVGSPIHHQQQQHNLHLHQGNGHQPLSRRNSTPPQRNMAALGASLPPASPSITIESLGSHGINGHRKLDRCHSEPVDKSLVCTSPTNVNTSRYKTELCRPYEESGVCKYGDKCQFAHGAHELRNLARHPKYKTDLCRTFHTSGFCPYGPRCHFIHNAEEARIRGATPTNMASMIARPKPVPLGGSAFSLHGGSQGESPSPPCSLSESPTSSLTSFFSEPDLLFPSTPYTPVATPKSNVFTFGPEFTATLLQIGASGANRDLEELSANTNTPPPSPLDRLPVFNQMSRVHVL
ncbi:protein TIS11 [Neocloeon triangulifer]|uniref:protein TIS11 n=1 Tax=Neocloeon triangulifer TaxID=2078957 RepID=UPI00286F0F4A|nr:protein TIS11 [Neocloeon triangulifer]